jgi:tRNA threonylcarbamoyl adenosine modification protein (Sua5/YciO/YrdC/YwlC family)
VVGYALCQIGLMSQFFNIHSENPQNRLVVQVADCLNQGGVVVYPTDACYAIGCSLDNKRGMDRIRRIRQLKDDHEFTLLCRDLSDLGLYARVPNPVYRALKQATPGPYTFILEASKLVPKRLVQPKRKTIGLRVPDHQIIRAILEAFGGPLVSTTLSMPGDEYPLNDPFDIKTVLEQEVEIIVDGGYGGLDPTTVVDFTGATPEILRRGCGDATVFGV